MPSHGLRTWRQLRLAPPREPQPWEDLWWCNASLQTPAGEVAVSWRFVRYNHTRAGTLGHARKASTKAVLVYLMDVLVPVNAQASIVVPTVVQTSSVTIFESGSAVWAEGKPASSTVAGIEQVTAGVDSWSVTLEAGSGSYSFRVFAK
eukprot:COSAG01_NODE_3415_length_6122_cov_15.057945_4_plen_148_part_00